MTETIKPDAAWSGKTSTGLPSGTGARPAAQLPDEIVAPIDASPVESVVVSTFHIDENGDGVATVIRGDGAEWSEPEITRVAGPFCG